MAFTSLQYLGEVSPARFFLGLFLNSRRRRLQGSEHREVYILRSARHCVAPSRTAVCSTVHGSFRASHALEQQGDPARLQQGRYTFENYGHYHRNQRAKV